VSRQPVAGPLVECVPNVSEGRDRGVIDALAAAVSSVPRVTLLDVDPEPVTHRTVFTFAADPIAVEEAALNLVRVAAGSIDMAKHRGVHPRIGAVDVLPFVPYSGASMSVCVDLARRVGRRIGEEIGIPVFLYGAAASVEQNASLAKVRRGGYEALPDRSDRPDFGPAAFNSRSGATAVGARPILIAYNVTLDKPDGVVASTIAAALRTSGRAAPPRAPDTRLQHLQAMGWVLEPLRVAQVSCNLVDWQSTPPHVVFDACTRMAKERGLGVRGSDIVGMVPLGALLAAGDHALGSGGAARGASSEGARIAAGVSYLGLEDLRPFDPEKKVLEYRLAVQPGNGLSG
jgi:glutamate formiminotransferase / formiminotetrahydrofolate cyclodeaminase